MIQSDSVNPFRADDRLTDHLEVKISIQRLLAITPDHFIFGAAKFGFLESPLNYLFNGTNTKSF